MLKVVVDTNVLVSALIKPKSNPGLIVSLLLEKQLKLCATPEILKEYQEVFSYDKFKGLDQNKVKNFLKRLKKDALIVNPSVSVNIIKEHPADNKFLECAIEAKADFLITGNKKHFPFKSYYHTYILTPQSFLYIIAKLLLK